jgi:hypothetical protein
MQQFTPKKYVTSKANFANALAGGLGLHALLVDDHGNLSPTTIVPMFKVVQTSEQGVFHVEVEGHKNGAYLVLVLV